MSDELSDLREGLAAARAYALFAAKAVAALHGFFDGQADLEGASPAIDKAFRQLKEAIGDDPYEASEVDRIGKLLKSPRWD